MGGRGPDDGVAERCGLLRHALDVLREPAAPRAARTPRNTETGPIGRAAGRVPRGLSLAARFRGKPPDADLPSEPFHPQTLRRFPSCSSVRRSASSGPATSAGASARSIAMKELSDVVLVDIPNKDKPELHMPGARPRTSPAARRELRRPHRGHLDYADIAGSDGRRHLAGLPEAGHRAATTLSRSTPASSRTSPRTSSSTRPQRGCHRRQQTRSTRWCTSRGRSPGFRTTASWGRRGRLDVARLRPSSPGTRRERRGHQGLLLGGHGDDMVPLPRLTSVNGIPVTDPLCRGKSTPASSALSRWRRRKLMEHQRVGTPVVGWHRRNGRSDRRDKRVIASRRVLVRKSSASRARRAELFVGPSGSRRPRRREGDLLQDERHRRSSWTSRSSHVKDLVGVVKYPEFA